MSNRSVVALDSYSMFLREMNKAPVLSREEEVELAVSLRDKGDIDAAHKLILSQLRTVYHIANEYYKFGLQQMDLIQEGVIGLMKAVKKFDPDKGFRLSTYASFWIRESIHNFILNSWSIVKIGTTKLQRAIFSGLKNARESIAAIDGENADVVAKQYGITSEKYRSTAGRILNRDTSFEHLNQEGIMFESEDATPEEVVIESSEKKFMSKSIRNALETLSDRDRYIFTERRLSDTPKGLKELSAELDVSMERIRQLENRAFKKVKAYLEQECEFKA